MWRVILSVVAVGLDVFFLPFAAYGIFDAAHPTIHAQSSSSVHASASGSGALVVVMAVFTLAFILNILAILFGARLPIGRKRRDDVAKVFE